MNTLDICLNALLVVGVLTAMTGAKSYAVDARVRREMGAAFSGATVLLSVATTGLWIWLAVLTGFWQIGALVALGFVTRYAIAASHREPKAAS